MSMSKGDLEPQQSGVLLAAPTDSVADCLDKMAKGNVGSILVADDSKIHGILTERDLLKHWRKLSDEKFLAGPVTSIATPGVFSMTIKDIANAPKEMLGRKIRHIPLTDDAGKVIGMMSMRDVLKAVVQASGGLKLEAKKEGAKGENAGPPSLLHVLNPTAQLAEICRRFVPGNWKCEIWQSVSGLVQHLERLEPKTLSNNAFVLDLDGVGTEDWRPLVSKLIEMMKQADRPEIFVVTSAKKFSEKDRKTIEMIAQKASWHAYQRPLAVAPLAEELGGLNGAKKS